VSGRSRRRPLLWIGVLLVLIVVGLGLSRTVKSPAEAAATTAPPARAVLTAAVECKVLTSTLIERGTVVGDRSVSVTPPLEASQAQVQYLTAVRARTGDEVRAGGLVLAVSGRPLIALQGNVPAYRDLVVGDSGADVVQLQNALAVVGGAGGDPRGVFGAATGAALQRLFAHVGYPPVPAGGQASLPLAEVAFVPSLPARVTALNGAVGDLVKAPLVSFETGRLHVSVSLDPAQSSLITRGMKVALVAEAIDKTATGSVSDIGALSASPASAGAPASSTVPVQVTPAHELGSAWLDQDVRVTFTSAKTTAPVLVVPEAALTTSADGSTRVTVHGASGDRSVVVRAGASGDGEVEVTPDSGALSAGDLVLVGR